MTEFREPTAIGVDHLEFTLHVRSHPECGRMFQRVLYQIMQVEMPGQDPKVYFTMMILRQLAAARLGAGDLFDLRTRFPDSTPEDSGKLMVAVFDIIANKGIHDPDSLAAAISESDDTLPNNVPPHPSSAEPRRQISLVLSESNR